jgi:hypothetical protein
LLVAIFHIYEVSSHYNQTLDASSLLFPMSSEPMYFPYSSVVQKPIGRLIHLPLSLIPWKRLLAASARAEYVTPVSFQQRVRRVFFMYDPLKVQGIHILTIEPS